MSDPTEAHGRWFLRHAETKLARAREIIAAKNAADDKIGSWLSAALEDPGVCAEMKADIEQWFAALALKLDEPKEDET